ncbi:MAG: hypothetical protein J1F64_03565 [Oscillospiraceae bacterium]|nr:hypothetical protein [Oscillospiraceae bacterium]
MGKKLMILIITGAIALSVSSCGLGQAEKGVKDALNSLQTSDSKEVRSIKNSYLSAYSTDVTLGDAFENFFMLPMWQYFEADTGEKVVEFNGQCIYNDKTVEATIQFILNDDGTFQVHTLAFNDIEQNLLMLNTLMEKIFEDSNSETEDDEGWVEELYEDYMDKNSDDSDDVGGAYKALTDEEVQEVYGFSKPDLARITHNSYLSEYSDEYTIGDVLRNLSSDDNWEWECMTVYEHRYEVEFRGNCYYNGKPVKTVIRFGSYPGSLDLMVYSMTINGESQSYETINDFFSYAYDFYERKN